MDEIVKDYYSEDYYLAHHGIKGQKWGVRRYQNPDGTLTSAGRKRLKRKFVKSYIEASNTMKEEGVFESINKKYEDKTFDDPKTKIPFSTKDGQAYIKEFDQKWRSTYLKALKKNSPELFEYGEKWVSEAPFMNLYSSFIDDLKDY